ncbi:MAG: carboxymuconolactone decarboxylase family protein, partial [Myxococcota bacterium]
FASRSSRGGRMRQVLDDFETADIPELHKLCWRWTRRFVERSWESTQAEIQELRDAGIPDREIVHWAESASVQTWWVMSADAGGVPLDEFTPTSGRVVGLERQHYESSTRVATAAPPGSGFVAPATPAGDRVAWVETDLQDPAYLESARWARERYGFVPNFFKAFSLRPALYPRHRRALELLEAPVSRTLDPRRHALVRALVSSLNRSAYGADTTRPLLERTSGDPDLWERVTGDYTRGEWDETDRAVLDFAAKMTRCSYRVSDKDAARFVDVGLDAGAYVEVANVVSIQTSIERVANSFGIVPDRRPLLR